MSGTNIVSLAPALQWRRAHQFDRDSYAGGQWLIRYPEGIDGLWTGPRPANSSGAVILPFKPRDRTAD
jgi:hypothetical protein